MKVLHCIHSLNGGGAERQLSLIAAHAERYGFDVAVFCVSDEVADDSYAQIKIYKSLKDSRISFALAKDLKKAIKDYAPDIVHAWLPWNVTVPAMVLGRMHGCKVAFSFRNRMFFYKPILLLEYLAALCFADKVVSNNPIEQSSLFYRKLYAAKNGCMIPNAVRVASGDFQSNESEEGLTRLVSFGRLTRQKNYPAVLEALSTLSSESKWSYEIYGAGEDRVLLDRLIQRFSLDKRVVIYDFTDDIHKIMQSADCLIFPSKWEGMPNVLVEAVALGMPAIVSDIPANKYALQEWEDSFYWFDLRDTFGLAQCIYAIVKKGVNRLNEEVTRGVETKFSTERLLTNYADCYRTMLR